MVLNEAIVPGQFVRLVKGVALRFVSTVNVALFVTVPQRPFTTTLYEPASDEPTEDKERDELVWPFKRFPSFIQK